MTELSSAVEEGQQGWFSRLRSGVSLRAACVGMLLCVVIGAGEPYAVGVLHTSPLCADFSTGGALFLFFILTFVVNGLLLRLAPRCALNSSELLVCYAMMIVASAIPSWGFMMNVIPQIASPVYYANATNRWEEEVIPFVPRWLFVWDRDAVFKFFEGKRVPVPWRLWATPLLGWAVFILAFYAASSCIMVIFRRQWVEYDHLSYPLVQIPVEMCGVQIRGALKKPLYRDWRMWLGFAIPAILYTIRGLNVYYPTIPVLNASWDFFIAKWRLWVALVIYFDVLGLAFLVPLDVSLSLWVFTVLYFVEQGLFYSIGFQIGPRQPYSDPGGQEVSHQALGAMVALVAVCLWRSRRHLGQVFRKALFSSAEVDDSDEVLGYRAAVLVTALCTLVMFGWFVAVGFSPIAAAVVLFWLFVIFFGLARVIAQTGLAYYRAPVVPSVGTIETLGYGGLGPRGIMGLMFTEPYGMDTRTTVMASTANGLMLAEAGPKRKRGYSLCLALAIVVTLIASGWACIHFAYAEGASNLGGWGFHSGHHQWIPSWLRGLKAQHVGVGTVQAVFFAIGAATFAITSFLQARFYWWPIHPIGAALGLTHPVFFSWFSIFVAWAIKTVVIRVWGDTGYRAARPFFLGIVLGSFTTAGFWAVIFGLKGQGVAWFTLG